MDRVEKYRQCVRQLVERYAGYKPSYGDVRAEAIIDAERDHYEVVHVGWEGRKRVHGSVIHIDVRDGKVWIEYNGTDRRIAEELVETGIPKQDVVLGFYPPEKRPLSGYGVG